MTRQQALVCLGLDGRATPDDIAQAIAREYRLWQSRTNAPDFEAQTHARRRVKELGQAEIVLLGDRRTRSHQPSPTPAAPRAPAPPPYGQRPTNPGWAPPQGPGPEPEQGPSAPRWSPPAKPPVEVGDPIDVSTRCIAKIIDIVAISIVNGIGAGLLSGTNLVPNSSTGREIIAAVIATTLAITYFTAFESTQGVTLGKMAMKIEVTDTYGNVPSVERALKRNVWIGLLIIPILGWLALAVAAVTVAVSIQNSQTRQGWHDDFAGRTQVIKAA
jgi:uncharacterized RDD family membrane protein YckC